MNFIFVMNWYKYIYLLILFIIYYLNKYSKKLKFVEIWILNWKNGKTIIINYANLKIV